VYVCVCVCVRARVFNVRRVVSACAPFIEDVLALPSKPLSVVALEVPSSKGAKKGRQDVGVSFLQANVCVCCLFVSDPSSSCHFRIFISLPVFAGIPEF